MHLVQRLVELKSEERQLVRQFEQEMLRLAQARVVKLPSQLRFTATPAKHERKSHGLD